MLFFTQTKHRLLKMFNNNTVYFFLQRDSYHCRVAGVECGLDALLFSFSSSVEKKIYKWKSFQLDLFATNKDMREQFLKLPNKSSHNFFSVYIPKTYCVTQNLIYNKSWSPKRSALVIHLFSQLFIYFYIHEVQVF